jgi:hypothetical protein
VRESATARSCLIGFERSPQAAAHLPVATSDRYPRNAATTAERSLALALRPKVAALPKVPVKAQLEPEVEAPPSRSADPASGSVLGAAAPVCPPLVLPCLALDEPDDPPQPTNPASRKHATIADIVLFMTTTPLF